GAEGAAVGGAAVCGLVGPRASGEGRAACGEGAGATGVFSTSIGHNSYASGGYSVALGANSFAPAANSVALGADSYADRDNTVSVGDAGTERQITNVAAGTEGTDAVNLDQLEAVAEVAENTDRYFKATGDGEAFVTGEDAVAAGSDRSEEHTS